ncbi:uncharacterized protein LOC143545302 [Bidens hawaiensis]|uniref:uncharacterized protein LOC143545302 n=1 Tax=Bidens hawaiensis TaxID=980011 RepID=UPI00404AD2F5
MDIAFKGQIGRNLEVYMDDLVIKSVEEDQMLRDIEETFETLKSINMKLNPAKCSFGMEEGKFLGVIVKDADFKANPDKVQAIARMPSPSSLKEVQTLNGRLVSLNRFLANHAAKSHPFISTLRNCIKKAQFKWIAEAEQAFLEVKKMFDGIAHVNSTPCGRIFNIILVSIRHCHRGRPPNRSKECPNADLLRQQNIIGPRNKIFHAGKTCFGIDLCCPSSPQVLADFVAEVPHHKETECLNEQQPQVPPELGQVWSLFTDGAPSSEGCGAGLRLVNPEGHEFTYAIKLDFKSTYNEAEYEAFLAGLRIAKKLGVKHLEARVDSMLIAGQINGTYEAKNDIMASYVSQAKDLMLQFSFCKVIHIKRSENKSADILSKLASTNFEHFAKDIRIEVLDCPSVPQHQVLVIQTGVESWMTPILAYLSFGALPEGKSAAWKIKHKALNYQIMDGVLYRRSFLGPLLRCVDAEDSNYLIREVHEGICGLHAGPRMVVAKVMNAGYYWPGMHADAVHEIRKCDSC